MAATRSPLSLTNSSTGVLTGRTVDLRRACTRFTAQITVTGSTKAIVRVKGSVDGVHFVSLGAANTTATSTATVTVSSTATHAFRFARIDQVSMVVKAGGQSVVASVSGA